MGGVEGAKGAVLNVETKPLPLNSVMNGWPVIAELQSVRTYNPSALPIPRLGAWERSDINLLMALSLKIPFTEQRRGRVFSSVTASCS